MHKRILVTGAAGYLGAHIALALAQAGHRVIGLDNFARGERAAVATLRQLCGERFVMEASDVRDRRRLIDVFRQHAPQLVVHAAALTSQVESFGAPLAYYDVNVSGTNQLLAVMQAFEVRRLVYVSSSAVYGAPLRLPVPEFNTLAPRSPFARTVAMVERLLADLAAADFISSDALPAVELPPRWQIAVLRVFSVMGQHESGLFGPWRRRPGEGLGDALAAAAQDDSALAVQGTDYATADGSAVRDYVHVSDVAQAHVAAVEALLRGCRSFTVNIGSGEAHSVFEVTEAFRRATGSGPQHRLAPRRPGDIAEIFADCSRARTLLGWSATRSVESMCRDLWRARRVSRLNPKDLTSSSKP